MFILFFWYPFLVYVFVDLRLYQRGRCFSDLLSTESIEYSFGISDRLDIILPRFLHEHGGNSFPHL